MAEMTKAELMEVMEQMRAELEALKAEKAEAAKKPAKKQAGPKDQELLRKVKIKLPRDNNKHRDPLYVNVNDKNWLIQRGVQVEVPYYVALVIQQSADADEKTAMMISGLEAAYTEQ